LIDMHSTARLSTIEDINEESTSTLNVVVAYEDFLTGKKAKETCDFLAENLGTTCQVNNQMWKFDVLSILKLRDMAVNDALQADIVMVSCHGGDELPEAVREWLRAWLERAPEAIALVGLFDCTPEQSAHIRKYLSEAVRGSSIEFFAQPHDWPGEASAIVDILPLSEVSPRSRNNHARAELGVSAGRWSPNE
jgi:hypothetical protein